MRKEPAPKSGAEGGGAKATLVYFRPADLKALRLLAAWQETSVSALVRDAVGAHLLQGGGQGHGERAAEQINQAAQFITSFRSSLGGAGTFMEGRPAHIVDPEWVQGATSLLFVDRTLSDITTGGLHIVRDRLASGCDTRFLLVNPLSPVAEALEQANLGMESVRGDIGGSLRALGALCAERSGGWGRMEVRLTDVLLPYGLAKVRREDGEEELLVQLILVGREEDERPHLRIEPQDTPWFTEFSNWAECLWERAGRSRLEHHLAGAP